MNKWFFYPLTYTVLLTLTASAESVYMSPTDSVGNRKYNNHDFKMQGNKIIPVDSVGNRDYKRSGYVAK